MKLNRNNKNTDRMNIHNDVLHHSKRSESNQTHNLININNEIPEGSY